jgi:hypothetical protein
MNNADCKSKIFFSILILTIFFNVFDAKAQTLKGKVTGNTGNKTEPLEGAVIKWINTKTGTATDANGNFELTFENIENITDRRITVFNIGYITDTIEIMKGVDYVEVTLKQKIQSTDVIEVEDEKSSTYISNDLPKTEVITSQELVKDACCDLAGCFGRNSSVEVAVTDIITDSKELKILGLEGAYTQILIDNTPMMNGLNVRYGVSSLPGVLIDRITISKGSNSVIQGYESISGIMNVLLKDYGNSDRFLLNGFINSMAEKQINLNYVSKLSNKTNNIFAFHSVLKSNRIDDNDDGFLDNPLITRYTFYNKWNIAFDKKSELNIAGRYWNEKRTGGQIEFNDDTEQGSDSLFGQTAKINSAEAYLRYSKEFRNGTEIKFFSNADYYDQKSFIGITKYNARQNYFSASDFMNLKFQKGTF